MPSKLTNDLSSEDPEVSGKAMHRTLQENIGRMGPLSEPASRIHNRHALEGDRPQTFAISNNDGKSGAGFSTTFFRNELGEVQGFLVTGDSGRNRDGKDHGAYISREQIEANPKLREGLQKMADDPGFRTMMDRDLLEAINPEKGERGPVVSANTYNPSSYQAPLQP